jgi:hypothetical protein
MWRDFKAMKFVLKVQATIISWLFATAVIWLIVAVVDGLVAFYAWGHYYRPAFHFVVVTEIAVIGGLLYLAGVTFAERHPVRAFRLMMWSAWTDFESTFRVSRWVINLVVLTYVLFYLTHEVGRGKEWAVWINENFLNFGFLNYGFNAVDVIRFEVLGFSIYIIMEIAYNYFCPQILKHSTRENGIPKSDVSLIFVETIERHGSQIPARDLYMNLQQFVKDHESEFSDGTLETINGRLAQLSGLVENPSEGQERNIWKQMYVGSAAGVARLLPDSLGTQIYYLGKGLFNPLYPIVRLCMRLLLWGALLLTSLPVGAKLLWLVAPRLVEMNMITVQTTPEGFRDSEWVLFSGKIEQVNERELHLVPDDQLAIRLLAAKDDVTRLRDMDGTERIFLRIGAMLRGISVRNDVWPRQYTPVSGNRMSEACPGGATMCSGGTEICCKTRIVAGQCYGSWSCP